MIRTHFYDTPREALIGLTEQLFKHFASTRNVRINVLEDLNAVDFSLIEIDIRYSGLYKFPPPLLAISGGESGKMLMSLWRECYSNHPLWEQLHYYWTDERCVPAESDESNFGTAYRTFFEPLYINASHIHPIHGWADDLPAEIERYTNSLCYTYGLFYDPARHPHLPPTKIFTSYFHCAVLGIGADWHIASIFTNKDSFHTQPYIQTVHPETGQQRITASYKTLFNTPRILIPLLGKEKAHLIKELYLTRKPQNPALRLLFEHPNVHIFTDNREYEWDIRNCREYI